MANESLARGASPATYGPIPVSEDKWQAIFGDKPKSKKAQHKSKRKAKAPAEGSRPPYAHGEYFEMCPRHYDPTEPTCTCTGGILCGACKALSMEELLALTIFGPTESNPKKPRKTRNARKPTALAGDNAKRAE